MLQKKKPSAVLALLLLFILPLLATAFFAVTPQPQPPVQQQQLHITLSPPHPTAAARGRQVVRHASNTNGNGGLVEGIFKFVRSDALSLTVGSLALIALVTNRLYTDPLVDSQSRTDILGVFSAGGLLLNGLTLQDITVREADTIELQGAQLDSADLKVLTPRQAMVLRWAADTYLETLSNTKSVLVWHKDRTVLRKGIMPSSSSGGPGDVEILAIVQKALTMPAERDGLSQPTYIPDLQVLPGKVEFTKYLPELCQAVVLQPFDNNKGLVVLGANKRRALTPKDLAKARVVAQKVQSCLAE